MDRLSCVLSMTLPSFILVLNSTSAYMTPSIRGEYKVSEPTSDKPVRPGNVQIGPIALLSVQFGEFRGRFIF